MSTSGADPVSPPELETLRRCPVFSALTDRELATLAGLLERRVFPAGTQVLTAGQPGDSCYVVDGGLVRVLRGGAPDGPPLAELGPGAFLGEGCLLSDDPHTATVRAATDVVAYRLARSDFDQLLEEDDLAAYRMLLAMAGQLHRRLSETTALVSALLDRPGS